VPQYDDHVNQAKRNIVFFENIHNGVSDCLDWQVTALFYTAVHLVSAHLAKFGLQKRNHNEIYNALNFANSTSAMRISEKVFTAYQSLQNESRKARYLINVKDGHLDGGKAHFIFTKHLCRALRNLDTIMDYFDSKYGMSLPQIQINCPEFKITPDIKFVRKVAETLRS
jgi:hypothetical protein